MDQEFEERPISREIVESYIFSTARGDFGVYAERLLIRLVEIAQCWVEGRSFRDGEGIGRVDVGVWGDADVIVPVKNILSGPDDNNYEAAKSAIRGLMAKFLEFENDDEYVATQILNDVNLKKVAGLMYIRINRNVWSAMLNFSKGFRKYDLAVALKLTKKYSVRIYKLISQQTDPITFSIDELRKMFGTADKYKRVDDFVKRTIVSAKEELDKVSPYTFEYTLNYSKSNEKNKGRKGRLAATSITIFPKYRREKDTPEQIHKKGGQLYLLYEGVYTTLRDKFEFSDKEIISNDATFDMARVKMGLAGLDDFLREIAPTALHTENPKGYVVNAIRQHLKETYNVVINKDSMKGFISSAEEKERMARATKRREEFMKQINGLQGMIDESKKF